MIRKEKAEDEQEGITVIIEKKSKLNLLSNEKIVYDC